MADAELFLEHTDGTLLCLDDEEGCFFEERVKVWQLREMAKVMENNGGYAPEFSAFLNIYGYLAEECINNYQEYYAPDDDEFWEKNTVDLGEELPEELLQAAEKYVKYKEVNIILFYEEEEEKTGNTLVKLPTATFWTMVEAVKTKTSERDDFAHLKELPQKIFDEVKLLVAKKAGNANADFILKDFPYQVLEQAIQQ